MVCHSDTLFQFTINKWYSNCLVMIGIIIKTSLQSRWSWDLVSATVVVQVSPSFHGLGSDLFAGPEPSIKKAYDSDCAGDKECSAFLNVCGIVLNALTKP